MANRSGNLVLKKAQKKIRTITRSLGEERKRFLHAHEQGVKRREAELKRLERRQRRYIRLMHKGFTALTVLARSTTMRKFFRITNKPFIFYTGPTTDSPDATIRLFRDRMELCIHWGYLNDEFTFLFNASEKYDEWVCGSPEKYDAWEYEYKKNDDSDDTCSTTSYWRVPRARRNRYDTGALVPSDLVLSVLIDCADPKKFESYLTDALKKNR